MKEEATKFLASYRVLDLTNEQGMQCGKTLAELGAEVIKVEKPGGDKARLKEPFPKDPRNLESSLFWLAFNRGKKSITLDITIDEGRTIFKELVQNADALVESFRPGYLDNIGLGYEELSKVNPGLVMTSITPFGQSGPYANFTAPDLIVNALSGFLYLTGDEDRVPVRITFPQAFIQAGLEGAAGTVLALYHRKLTGKGQQVDVSAQQCMAWCLRETHQWWDLHQIIQTRRGAGVRRPMTGTFQRYIWPCNDGYVGFFVLGGKAGARGQNNLVAWMDEEGCADEFLKNRDWEQHDFGSVRPETEEHIECLIGSFFMRHTKKELYEGALQRKIPLLPCNNIADIMEDAQLAFRAYWNVVQHDELGVSFLYPVSPQYIPGEPRLSLTRSAKVGEHNADMYTKELKLSEEKQTELKKLGVI